MNKYYVYHVERDNDTIKDRNHAYVEEDRIKEFVDNSFEPDTMKFTGIMVEADDPDEASRVFNYPNNYDGGYMMVDEPREVADKRLLLDMGTIAKALMLQSEIAKTKRDLIKLNNSISSLSRTLIGLKASTAVSPEVVYEKLKVMFAKMLKNDYKYNGKAK